MLTKGQVSGKRKNVKAVNEVLLGTPKIKQNVCLVVKVKESAGEVNTYTIPIEFASTKKKNSSNCDIVRIKKSNGGVKLWKLNNKYKERFSIKNLVGQDVCFSNGAQCISGEILEADVKMTVRGGRLYRLGAKTNIKGCPSIQIYDDDLNHNRIRRKIPIKTPSEGSLPPIDEPGNTN